MSHALILGMTESGKTTLAKRMAAEYKARGIGVIVLDPLKDPGWNADHITANGEEFLDVFWNSRSCAVFIDESGDAVGKYDLAMQRTATRGRHWGHSVHYLTQRGSMISRTVRDQCGKLFLFNNALEDCKIHAREWNKPGLLEASAFPPGHYFYTGRFSDLKRCKLEGFD